MNLKDIEIRPDQSLIYLDRYVNDGSPSGFTEKFKTSHATDTFNFNKNFRVLTIESSDSDLQIYGSLLPNIPLEKNHFYIHPDMKDHPDLKGCHIFEQKHFMVSPTSSFRTVKILSVGCNDYIKLHYDGVLGRISRQLFPMRAIAGVEVSKIIKDNLQNHIFSDFISIFEEPFTKILKIPILNGESKYWGMVWRNAKPFGMRSEKIKYIIPLFSFWSKDRHNSEAEVFGKQLFIKWGQNAKSKFLNEILIPILDTYFEFIVRAGLQYEYNAQNLLIGFDESWNAVSIICRDMMGIEKDLGIRKSLGLSTYFDSFPYKVIDEENPNYTIRHSFTFDFKVCDYVISPLVSLAANHELAKRDELIEILRERVKHWLLLLPDNFFPKSKWYSHDKVLLNVRENRVYIENKNPLLRD